MKAILKFSGLGTPPLTNHLYYTYPSKGGKGTYRTKTSYYNDFRSSIERIMSSGNSPYEYLLKLFSKVSNSNLLKLSLLVEVDETKYYTKNGTISNRVGDTDGYLKGLQDSIFDLFDGYNDRIVSEVSIIRKPSKVSSFTLTLEVLDGSDATFNCEYIFEPITWIFLESHEIL